MTRAALIAVVCCVAAVGVAAAGIPIARGHKLIAHVTGENFRQEVVDPTIPVVVAFLTPRDKASKAFAPEFEKAVEALQGFATFKVMDASQPDGGGVAQMFGINSFPALVLFNPEMLPVSGGQEGQYMKLPVGYNGAAVATKIAEWVLASIDGHQIERIEDEVDLADFMNKFAVFELPKILLFQKESNVTSPSFKVMSHIHRYGALFGVVPPAAPPAIAASFGLETLPAVVSIAAGDETEVMREPPADVNLENLNAFISKVALTREKKMQMQGVFLEEEQKLRKKEAEEAKMNRALPLVVAKSKEDWETHCIKRKKGTCVAVFLDGLTTVPEEMLNNCSRKIAPRTSTPVQVVALDGLYNYKLVQFFDLNDGLPAIVYIQPGKKVYQTHIGSFQERSIVNFYMEKVGKVRGKRYDAKSVPEFAETPKEEDDGGDGGDELADELTDEM